MTGLLKNDLCKCELEIKWSHGHLTCIMGGLIPCKMSFILKQVPDNVLELCLHQVLLYSKLWLRPEIQCCITCHRSHTYWGCILHKWGQLHPSPELPYLKRPMPMVDIHPQDIILDPQRPDPLMCNSPLSCSFFMHDLQVLCCMSVYCDNPSQRTSLTPMWAGSCI